MNQPYQQGAQKALELFHTAYEAVPAYRHFIDEHGINPDQVKTPEDFHQIPTTDKANYIKKYPLEQRLYRGKQVSDYYMLCSSSGTSGEPTFWPRDFETDQKLEKAKYQLFEDHFNVSQQKTLCLITFGLGVWTAGMLSTKLSWPVGQHNQFTVMTPGLDKENTFKLIQALHPAYDQIILLGYPPFLTDLVEHAVNENFDLKQANLRLFYTSERVSEDWRTVMTETLHDQANRHHIVGFYACSDTGIIGAETKTSIDILNRAHQDHGFCEELFGTKVSPTFVTFNPKIKFIESVDNEITITADQPVPLIRYNIHDRGSLISKAQIIRAFNNTGISHKSLKLDDNYLAIFGRSDAVKVTANVYVEDIRYCLEKSQFRDRLSGHFQYGTEQLPESMRYRLKIQVYLKPKAQLTREEREAFETEFYDHLLEANNDFKMIQSGTTIEKFKFEYLVDPKDKYQTSKLKHFLWASNQKFTNFLIKKT